MSAPRRGKRRTVGYLVYARRFRPQRFDEVVGQKSAVESLRGAIRQGRVAHAYLFCGPRGVGKTTTARILAKSLNCEKGPAVEPCGECASCIEIAEGRSLDVVEIDAASHASVEDIRALREEAVYSTHGSRYRVYIIDEVHMLATSSQQAAFNAFLKILEEPPPHVKFVLCTTDPERIIETVRSRCQRLDFRRITMDEAVARLRQIAEREGLEVEEGALEAVARHAEGGLRDAEVLLEQLSVYSEGPVTADHVRALTGAPDEVKLSGVVCALAAGDAGLALENADAMLESGADAGELTDALLDHLRSALALQACGGESPVVRSRGIQVEPVGSSARALTQEELLYAAAVLQTARREARSSARPRTALELALVRLSRVKDMVKLEEIASRLREAAPSRPGRSGRRGESPGARGEPPGPRRSGPRSGGGPEETQSPREEEAATPPPPPEGKLTLEAVAERWPFIEAAVARRSVPAAALLRNGSPCGVEGGTISVGFSAKWAFHREKLSGPEMLGAVAEAVSEVLGRPVRVSLVGLREGGAAPAGTRLRGDEAAQASQARRAGASGAKAGDSRRGRAAARSGADRGGVSGGEGGTSSCRAAESEALRDPRLRKLVEKSGGRIVGVEREGG